MPPLPDFRVRIRSPVHLIYYYFPFRVLMDNFSPSQYDRFEAYRRHALPKQAVRKVRLCKLHIAPHSLSSLCSDDCL